MQSVPSEIRYLHKTVTAEIPAILQTRTQDRHRTITERGHVKDTSWTG